MIRPALQWLAGLVGRKPINLIITIREGVLPDPIPPASTPKYISGDTVMSYQVKGKLPPDTAVDIKTRTLNYQAGTPNADDASVLDWGDVNKLDIGVAEGEFSILVPETATRLKWWTTFKDRSPTGNPSDGAAQEFDLVDDTPPPVPGAPIHMGIDTVNDPVTPPVDPPVDPPADPTGGGGDGGDGGGTPPG